MVINFARIKGPIFQQILALQFWQPQTVRLQKQNAKVGTGFMSKLGTIAPMKHNTCT